MSDSPAHARDHAVTPAQVSIRWILQHDVTTIPKSIHDERIRQNAEVFAFELSAAEIFAAEQHAAKKAIR